MEKHKFMFIKKCPDGSLVTLKFYTQEELLEHLNAMSEYTTGYEIVSIFLIPNN